VNNRYIYSILMFITIFIGGTELKLDAQYKAIPSFKQKIQNFVQNQLKALALALVLEGYKQALEMARPLTDAGRAKLQGTIDTIKIAIAQYEQDQQFQEAKQLALTATRFPYMVNNKANLIAAKKRAEPNITDQEASNKIFENALAELNNVYNIILEIMVQKNNVKNTVAPWPSEINVLNFNSVIGNWSSFADQAQRLKS